jgi:hypothetical protein
MKNGLNAIKYFALLQSQLAEEEREREARGKKGKKRYFTVIEDEMLIFLVKIMGEKKWKEIAKMIPNKNVRQCRERYKTYLKPGINHNDWTKEEDTKLVKLVAEMGPKWAVLTNYFPGRTDNSLKNRYNVHLNKGDKSPSSQSTDSNSSNSAYIDIMPEMPSIPLDDFDSEIIGVKYPIEAEAWNADFIRDGLL